MYLPWNNVHNPNSISLLNGARTLLGGRKQGSTVNWFVYIEIFTPVAWGVCFLALFILAMALVLHSYQKSFTNDQQQQWKKAQEKISILTSLSVAFRMLLNLGFQLKMKSYPSMIIILSGSLLGYLFFSLYTSDLTAKMTANPPPMPIRYIYVLGRCSIE